jgi:hypothetical protein
MTGRRFALLLAPAIATALILTVGGGGCSDILELGDYSLCGAGGTAAGGAGDCDDGGSDGSTNADAAP